MFLNSLPWFVSPVPLWQQLGVVALWMGAIVLTSELLHRSKLADGEVVRKVVHIGTGNVILLAWWLGIPAWVGITASVVFSLVALLSYRLPILPGINSVGRKSLGTFFYAVSIGVLIAGFWNHAPYYAVLGVLVMTWGDGLAALVGQRWGIHRYELWDMKKSWEGSLTMLLVSVLVSSLVLSSVQGMTWQTGGTAVGVAIVATGLEAFSKWGVDNLTVPVAAGVIAYWLNPFM